MSTLEVALILNAVNNLNPGINSAISKVKEYKKAVDNVKVSGNSSFNDQWFKSQLADMEEIKRKAKELQNDGTIQLAKGFAEAQVFGYVIDYAAEFEQVMKKVELANYDASIPLDIQKYQLQELSKLATQLGKDTVFSTTDAAKAELALIKNGMDYIDVLKGGAMASVYLAQTAEVSTDAAADAISQITNMYQLQGSQLMQTADDINRAANASSAGVINIMHDMQQAGQTAHNLGLDVKETSLLLGTLHNMGLGDSSGTFLNDLLLRLDAVSPEAQKALYSLGLLNDAKVVTTKSGKTKIVGGKSSLFDDTGQLKSAQDLVNSLRQTLYNNQIDPKMLFDKSGSMVSTEDLEKIFGAKKANQVIKDMKEAFGIQGMRAAIALTVSGKGSYEEMLQKAQRMKDIQEQVLEMQGTLAGMFEAAKGSWDTLMTASSSPLGQELKKSVSGVTGFINKAIEWVNVHPKITTGLLKILAGLAGMNIAMGAGKLLIGNFIGNLTGIGGAALKSIRYLKGFGDSYKFLTGVMGHGGLGAALRSLTFGTKLDFIPRVLGSIGKGALSTASTIGKVGASFLKTGAMALVAGARMALAWFIGLGPIGWIIAGITVLVAGAIAAWKTNFLGFRDKVLEVWDKVKEIFNKVKEFFGFKSSSIDVAAADQAITINKSLNSSGRQQYIQSNNNGSVVDNRKYVYNVQSTDPRLAAKEITRDNTNDKYYKSRDPKLAFGH